MMEDQTHLGDILVKLGCCERDDIEDALEHQAQVGETAQLGVILVELQRVTPKQLQEALRMQKRLRKEPLKALGPWLSVLRKDGQRVKAKLDHALEGRP